MKDGNGVPFEQASEMCRGLIELLMPACKPTHCQAAGSIRRMKPRPNDIEIVCEPIIAKRIQLSFLDVGITLNPANLPGQNALDMLCNMLLSQGVLEKRLDKNGRPAWGSRLKRAVYNHEGSGLFMPLDLFAVIEPVTWGVIYAIRTGPDDFNRLLVTNQRHGGACPLNRKVAGGRVWDISQLSAGRQAYVTALPAGEFVKIAEKTQIPVLDTSRECDFFAALDVPRWASRLRTVERLQEYLQTRSV